MYKKVSVWITTILIVLVEVRAQPIKLNKLYGITNKYFNKKDKLLNKIFDRQFHFHIHDHHLHYDHVQQDDGGHQIVHHHNHQYENEQHNQQQNQQNEHQHSVYQNQQVQNEEQTTEKTNELGSVFVESIQHNTENPNQQLNTLEITTTTTTKQPEFIINVQPNIDNPHNQVQQHPNYGYNLSPPNIPFNNFGTNQPLTLQQHQILSGKPEVLQQVPPIINNPLFLLPPEYSLHYDYNHYNNNGDNPNNLGHPQ